MYLYLEYNNTYRPVFTIHPNFVVEVIIFTFFNLITWYAVNRDQKVRQLNHIIYVTYLIQNIIFVLELALNPYIIPKDPTIHSNEYLGYLAYHNLRDRICDRCLLIKDN